jgi:hypothetical protein
VVGVFDPPCLGSVTPSAFLSVFGGCAVCMCYVHFAVSGHWGTTWNVPAMAALQLYSRRICCPCGRCQPGCRLWCRLCTAFASGCRQSSVRASWDSVQRTAYCLRPIRRKLRSVRVIVDILRLRTCVWRFASRKVFSTELSAQGSSLSWGSTFEVT